MDIVAQIHVTREMDERIDELVKTGVYKIVFWDTSNFGNCARHLIKTDKTLCGLYPGMGRRIMTENTSVVCIRCMRSALKRDKQ